MRKTILLITYLMVISGCLQAQDTEETEQGSIYSEFLTARNENNPEARLKAAQMLLRRDPSFAPAWVLIGTVYNTMSQMPHLKAELYADSARIAAKKALEIDSQLAEAKSFAALLDFLNGEITSSRNHQYWLDTELEISRGLSFNNWNEGRLLEAYKWADAAITAYPTANWSHRYYGIIARSLGFYQEAEQHFSKLVVLSDDVNLDAHLMLGLTYVADSRSKKAEEQYQIIRNERYYDEGKVYLNAFLLSSQLGILLGHCEESLSDLSFFLEATNNYWIPPQAFGFQLTTQKAFLLKKGKLWDDAEIALDQSETKANALIEQGNEGFGVYLDLAAIYSIRENKDLMIEHLQKAIKRGYRDTPLLAENPMFEPFSESNEFKAILEDIRLKVERDAQAIQAKGN